ncbi:hypothetical protein PCE1_003218 [Barthelona sp. PCE]
MSEVPVTPIKNGQGATGTIPNTPQHTPQVRALFKNQSQKLSQHKERITILEGDLHDKELVIDRLNIVNSEITTQRDAFEAENTELRLDIRHLRKQLEEEMDKEHSKYDELEDQAEVYRRKYDDKVSECRSLKKRHADEIDEYNRLFEDFRDQIQHKTTSLNDAKVEVGNLSTEIKSKDEEISGVKSELADYKQQVGFLSEVIEGLERNSERMGELQDSLNDSSTLVKEKESLIDDLNASIERQREVIAKRDDTIDELKADAVNVLDELKSTKEVHELELASVRDERNTIKNELEDTISALQKRIDAKEGEFQSLSAETGESRRVLDEREAEVHELKDIIATLNERIKTMEKEYKSLSDKSSERGNVLDVRISELMGAVQEKDMIIKSLNSDITDTKEELEEVCFELQMFIDDNTELKASIANFTRQGEKNSHELSLLNQKNEAAEAELRNANTRIEQFMDRFEQQNKALDQQNDLLEEQNKKLQSIEEEKKLFTSKCKDMRLDFEQVITEFEELQMQNVEENYALKAEIAERKRQTVALNKEKTNLEGILERMQIEFKSVSNTINGVFDEVGSLKKLAMQNTEIIEEQQNDIEDKTNQLNATKTKLIEKKDSEHMFNRELLELNGLVEILMDNVVSIQKEYMTETNARSDNLQKAVVDMKDIIGRYKLQSKNNSSVVDGLLTCREQLQTMMPELYEIGEEQTVLQKSMAQKIASLLSSLRNQDRNDEDLPFILDLTVTQLEYVKSSHVLPLETANYCCAAYVTELGNVLKNLFKLIEAVEY